MRIAPTAARRPARAQVLSLAHTLLRSRPDLDRLAETVVDGAQDSYSAPEQLLAPTPREQG
ncbi:hypothetical protein [Mycobacterium sp. E1747]|uniref:hypothetical protein n=1 Tax=Mycobacterium sp. E1747 TaxID=1834128 RepID=UPI000B2DDE8C|nr:hypothetical protein [Mycobacterium sp. E1747]